MKSKKITLRAVLAALLVLALCVGGFALGMIFYEVRDNSFETGSIEIDLNGGQAVITPEEYLFEPGMTVEKPFYIQNNGTWSVYYKLYFEEVSGDLGDVLEATVLGPEGETLLSGKLSELTQANVSPLESTLEVGQRHELSLLLHFPREEGNDHQDRSLSFRLSAVAVQTKNNPDKEFN